MKNSYKEILSELKLNPNTKFIKDSKVYIMNKFIYFNIVYLNLYLIIN